jgi:flagellar biosynthesis/type III secretory pathway chaperone
MYEYYEFYQIFRYQIPELLAISTFIRQNQVDITNIASVLKDAKDIFHLQSYRSEIKNEIERLKQNKNNQQYFQNNIYIFKIIFIIH